MVGPKLDAKIGEGEWKLPDWKVRFDCTAPMTGKATLTVALAGVTRPGEVVVSLNGKRLGSVMCPHGDSSIHRSGICGGFQEGFVTFDASLLVKGENVLDLEIRPEKRLKLRANHSPFGVMYDFV